MKLDLKSSPRHIKRLQNIAKVISGLDDVKVVIDSKIKGPYFNSDSKICFLPNGDYSDDNFVSLIEGFICHEAGHGRFTTDEVYSEAFDSVLKLSEGFIQFDKSNNAVFETSLQKVKAYRRAKRLIGIINTFDDIQMEEKVGINYPDAKRRLAATYALMVKAGRMTPDISTEPDNPVHFIEWYLLNSLRVQVLHQEGHKETLDPFFDYTKKLLAPVISEIDEIFQEALSSSSTEDCEPLARKTLALLERLRDTARDKQQQKQEEQKGQETTDNTQDSEETDADDESQPSGDGLDDSAENADDTSDTSGKDKPTQEDIQEPSEASKDSVDERCPSDGESNDESDTEGDIEVDTPRGANSNIDSSVDTEEKSNFSPEQWESLADLLDDFFDSDEDSEDYHDVLAKQIENIASHVSDEVKAEFGGDTWDIPDLEIDLNTYSEVLSLSHSIAGDLSVLQQVKTRGKNKTHERGTSFDANRLILSSMGVRDVFKTKCEAKNRGHVGLVIVRDISASMAGENRFVHAIKSDLALSLAAEAMSKMHVANIVYPYKDRESEVIKTFEQSVEETLSKFSLGCKGYCTPTGSALMAAAMLLLDSQFERKIILLITDGRPNRSEYSIDDVLNVTLDNGIEMVGVGIKTDEIIGFDKDTFVNVDDISLLSVEVSKLVHQILSI